jgi:hypothetical protein
MSPTHRTNQTATSGVRLASFKKNEKHALCQLLRSSPTRRFSPSTRCTIIAMTIRSSAWVSKEPLSAKPSIQHWSCSSELAPPIFIPEGQKVNTKAYISILKAKVLPWLKKNFPLNNNKLQLKHPRRPRNGSWPTTPGNGTKPSGTLQHRPQPPPLFCVERF